LVVTHLALTHCVPLAQTSGTFTGRIYGGVELRFFESSLPFAQAVKVAGSTALALAEDYLGLWV
jgi:hypothetical protein